MKPMHPASVGGFGYENQNMFGQQRVDHLSQDPEDDYPLEKDEGFHGEASLKAEGIQNNGGNDFWNQDFGTNNFNRGGFEEEDKDPNIGDDHFGGDNENQYQILEVKTNKPKMGQAFDAPLTPEEEARVAEIEQEQKIRMQKLMDKEANEIAEKRDRKDKAKEELRSWYEDKEKDRRAKSKQNKEEEWAFLKTRDEHKQSKNPWEKIIDNVEINQNKYLGTKDVTRMRQAMIARRADIKAQGNDIEDI